MEDLASASEDAQRLLALEGSYNIRDIGGYATLDGGSTRWGVFLRADSPNRLPPEAQRLLLAYPIRTIIDLRRTVELLRSPAVFRDSSDVRYIHVSLLEDESKVREAPSLEDLYRYVLENSQEQIKQIFELLATEDVFPCAIHCSVGKDRTGLITALLLSVANVPTSTIANDYALSEQYLRPLFTMLRARLEPNGPDGQRLEWMALARPETMLATLAYLEDQYGGVNGYLRKIGVSDEQLARLRSLLTEP
jgi:protein-tyrosine phosphatase